MIRGVTSVVALAAMIAVAACSAGDQQAVAPAVAAEEPVELEDQRVDLSNHGSHEYVAPDISTLGGAFSLVDGEGKPFTDQDLVGGWSVVYLGYMECQEACPIALAALPGAVRKLNQEGVAVRSVFIDINAPRLDDEMGGMARHDAAAPVVSDGATADASAPMHMSAHASGPNRGSGLTGPEIRRIALAEWGKRVDKDMIVLSGNRKQVLTALRLFKTRAEANMDRNAEVGHRINHTTNIYVTGPDGKVAGLLYHDTPMEEMIAKVRELEQQSKT